jgi:hypothetical protein
VIFQSFWQRSEMDENQQTSSSASMQIEQVSSADRAGASLLENLPATMLNSHAHARFFTSGMLYHSDINARSSFDRRKGSAQQQASCHALGSRLV